MLLAELLSLMWDLCFVLKINLKYIDNYVPFLKSKVTHKSQELKETSLFLFIHSSQTFQLPLTLCQSTLNTVMQSTTGSAGYVESRNTFANYYKTFFILQSLYSLSLASKALNFSSGVSAVMSRIFCSAAWLFSESKDLYSFF